MSKRYGNIRINLFLVLVLLSSSLILYRLFVLSVVRHSVYSKTAQAQNENISNVLARGNIYFTDKDGNPALAATNKKFPLVYIVPKDITESDRERVTRGLAGILKIDLADLAGRINLGSSSTRVIARRISNEQIEAVKALGSKGVGVSYETDRYYSGDSLAANVIGFLGFNGEGKRAGQYGIEEYYDQDLSGKNPVGWSLLDIGDTLGLGKFLRKITGRDEKESEEFDRPANVVLTIDKNVQNFVEEKLKAVTEKWQAESGTVIVQEPKTGKIVAMADWPSFNPNDYAASPTASYLNSNTQEVYEPGSSFKPVTMATGLDLAKITPQTTYEDTGSINIAGYTIHNFSDRIFGRQTMTQVLENSVNTGTMYVENLVGDENFLNYVINMGFGQKSGIDLPGEVSGDITNLYSGRKINYLTTSFGQGIAVTPLQLINAYSVIANGGKLMRPYIVEKIIREGEAEVVIKPQIETIPISEKTAVKVQTMLTSVVDNGFDKARISGYHIAGKTGTAQIPDGSGGYSKDDFIHNFVGFAPAHDARFVVLIKMNKPRGIQFAADSLSPTFREIAAYLINYYNVPPTR